MGQHNFKVNTGVQTFNFLDESDNVIASFRINPTDVKLLKRCTEVADYFDTRKDAISDTFQTAEEAAEFDAELEAKINYMLGYNAGETLFKPPMTATTILDDTGEIFATLIVRRIMEVVTPEIEKRNRKQQALSEQYTGKYE